MNIYELTFLIPENIINKLTKFTFADTDYLKKDRMVNFIEPNNVLKTSQRKAIFWQTKAVILLPCL